MCTQCSQEWGSEKFDKADLQNRKRRGDKTLLRCIDCKSKINCDACKTPYKITDWSAKERNNAQQKRTKLVCKSCRESGCTATDVELYVCRVCKKSLGATRFDTKALKNMKYVNRQKLECLLCATAVAKRVQLLKIAFQSSARFCKCFCPLHKERCPLSACYAGEKRWPGSDGVLSAEDRAFLDALNPRPAWWSRAWGRK